MFIRLLPHREFYNLPSLKGKRFYKRLFSPLVTLWYLVFQRLQSDHTLDAVVADALAGGADSLCKKLSKKIISIATVSYSNARQRLPLAFLSDALKLQARKLLALKRQCRWKGLRVCLLDGTNVRMRPHWDIKKKLGTYRNQAATAYWCLMRVVVCFCAHTGAALNSAMEKVTMSEQELACQIMLSEPISSRLFIGDRNFGVFRIVQTATHTASEVLLRLSKPRALKLFQRKLRLGDHAVCWVPGSQDQLEPGCSDKPISGRLIVARVNRKGFKSQTLYLFTTLPEWADYSAEELVKLYAVRWHVELNLRYLKSQMHLVQLECKSFEMAKKEWLAGLIGYNLIRAAMFCAALHEGISPLDLSFSTSRRHLEHWLWGFGQGGRDILTTWKKLLRLIGRARLPVRRKPRPPEPRAQRHLRHSFPPLIGSRKEARKRLKLCPKC